MASGGTIFGMRDIVAWIAAVPLELLQKLEIILIILGMAAGALLVAVRRSGQLLASIRRAIEKKPEVTFFLPQGETPLTG